MKKDQEMRLSPPCPVEVIRRPVRNVTIRVLADGKVRVTAPPGADISPALRERAQWIERKRAAIDLLAERHLSSSGCLPLSGSYHHLLPGPECRIDPEEKRVEYTTPRELKALIKKDLIQRLDTSVAALSANMDVSPSRIAVRTQKTRWASCSPKKTLSFNLRMAAIPPELCAYIIVHELAHLIEPNHSPVFWAVVRAHDPDPDGARRHLAEWWVALERNRVWRTLEGA